MLDVARRFDRHGIARILFRVAKSWKISRKFRKLSRNFDKLLGIWEILQDFWKVSGNVPPLCNLNPI